VPWLSIYGGPALAVAIMGLAIYAINTLGVNIWLSVVVGVVVYLLALLVTGVFRHDDMNVISKALPLERWRQRLPTGLGAVKIKRS
jgi:type IV secretory pathway TrbD component